MKKYFGGLIVVALGGLILATAPASAGLTADELKCELGAGGAGAKTSPAIGGCRIKCVQAALKAAGHAADCKYPYASGSAVETCVGAALGKGSAAEVKACVKDCPECAPYSGDCATEATTRMNNLSNTVGQLLNRIYCEDPGSKEAAKCQDAVTKTLGKFVAAKAKCYQGCRAAEFKGKVPPGSCLPPVSDPKTAACIAAAEAKAAAAIDKTCPAANQPNCFANPPPMGTALPNGAAWVAGVELGVDYAQPNTYCQEVGSPSGAFLE